MVFSPEQIRFQCVGSGDAFGSGGRLNSCYHLQFDQQQILLDCGCSSLIGLQRCGLVAGEVSSVIVSHLHGDHFGGIPFLLLEGKFISQRRNALTLIGPHGLQQQVELALNALYPGTLEDGFGFPIHYVELDPEHEYRGDGFILRAWPVNHGRSPHVYGVKIHANKKVIGYSGDTAWTDTLIPLSQGCDLMIVECFTYERSSLAHMDYQTLRSNSALLRCRQLMLTHPGSEVLARRDELEFDVLDDGDILFF